MRVGVVCPYSLTLPGGVQGQVLGLGAALRRLGVEARVLGPCDGPPPDASVTPLGNSVPTATAGNGSISALAPDPAATLRTIRALRDERFDVVHLHEPLVPGPALTSLLFAEAPLVGTFHRSGPSAVYRRLNRLARWGGDHLAARVAVSEQAKVTAENALGGAYEVLWNGIDGAPLAGAIPWPRQAPTIFFLARHETRKGLEVLIDAMRTDALLSFGADLRLWIGGIGPETAKYQAATTGDARIEWLGPITEDEKRRRLRGASVFCAPSLYGESFGVVLLEAMAAGTPVVASDLPGYGNVARSGIEACLVKPGDSVALGQALAAILAPGPVVEAMIEAGFVRIEDFSLDRLAARYVEIYERALAGGDR